MTKKTIAQVLTINGEFDKDEPCILAKRTDGNYAKLANDAKYPFMEVLDRIPAGYCKELDETALCALWSDGKLYETEVIELEEEAFDKGAIREELIDMLKDFDMAKNSYNTDIYAYKRDGGVVLDTFVNVGGNSWLDDDHICVYTSPANNTDILDAFDNISDIADYAGITEEQLNKEAAEYAECDEDELTFSEIYEYVESRDDYMDNIAEGLRVDLDEQNSYYIDIADAIIEKIEEELF